MTKLNGEINKILQMPDVKERFAVAAIDTSGGAPEQFAALTKADLPRWAAIVKKANIKAD